MEDIIKFVKRTIAFTILFGCVLIGFFYFFKSNLPESKRVGPGVYKMIKKSKKGNAHISQVVLGASVAAQMYPQEDSSKYILPLTSNQAVTIVGYYHVLNNFLENYQGNYDSLKVDLIYFPAAFRNGLDGRYTFNYYLKPFYKKEYEDEITPNAIAAINEIPYSWLSKTKLVRNSNWAPVYRVIHKPLDFRLSSLVAEYLLMMEAVCKKYNVEFQLRSPFMSDEFKQEKFELFKKGIKQHKVQHLFENYFEDIIWLESKYFVDKMHLRKKHIPEIVGENILNF